MKRNEGACFVCGKPLVYFETARELECAVCHGRFESYASCEDGHFVCDRCHGEQGIRNLISRCRERGSRNPIALLQELMEMPGVHMHGPEHHVMVGAALLTAYRNSGGKLDLEAALQKMKERGVKYPGGSCGYWGCCGAAVSAGMFLSVATETTPLSGRSWGLCNQMTAAALAEIGALGGPRCCKRNSFTAALAAARFVEERLGVAMELPDAVRCTHSPENKQCLKTHCPYYGG